MGFFKDYAHMVRNETMWATDTRELTMADTGRKVEYVHSEEHADQAYRDDHADHADHAEHSDQVSDVSQQSQKKTGMTKYWSVVATGAGLFSDGYINSAIGFVVTILKRLYGAEVLAANSAMSNISAIAFAGTVVGMLVFGCFSDYVSRKLGMLISTGILIVFSILSAGSWGVGMPEDPNGMFAALTTFRAFIGVGIGGEYPSGSVACAEASQLISRGSRNRWFVWFTNFMIDLGYVASAFVAWLLMHICGVSSDPNEKHGLQASWRILLGLGAIPPMSLLYLRTRFEDNDQFKQHNFKRVKTPWWLILKYYSPRLCVVSLIWFLYDFLSYSWGIYSSQVISLVTAGHSGDIKTTFGWNVLLYVFYIPGAFLGALVADYIGPRLTLLIGTLLQGIVGFIMCSQYEELIESTGAFVVAYGVFTALGEFGPGDNIGLIASKTSASAIRGRYYGIAAAIGKIGAFAGGYAFPAIANQFGGLDSSEGQSMLLYISSGLCVFSAFLALLLPPLTQSAVNDEDIKFRRYLEEHGFDTSELGDQGAVILASEDSVSEGKPLGFQEQVKKLD